MLKKKFTETILDPLFLIIVSNVIQYYYTKHQNANEVKRAYIQKQLNEFYLPLKNSLITSNLNWQEYNLRYGSQENFQKIQSDDDSTENLHWKIYMLTQFQQIHNYIRNILKRRDLVISNSDLNKDVDTLTKHVNEYQLTYYSLNNNIRHSTNIALHHYPKSIEGLLDRDIVILQDQLKILD